MAIQKVPTTASGILTYSLHMLDHFVNLTLYNLQLLILLSRDSDK